MKNWKWKLNLNLSLVLLLTLFLISGCNKTPQISSLYSGDYPAQALRSMWSFCVTNFQLKSPQTPPFLVAQMCDCYLNEMRSSHPFSHINNLSDNETRQMGLQLIRVCNVNRTPVQKYRVETLMTYRIPGYRCYVVRVRKRNG